MGKLRDFINSQKKLYETSVMDRVMLDPKLVPGNFDGDSTDQSIYMDAYQEYQRLAEKGDSFRAGFFSKMLTKALAGDTDDLLHWHRLYYRGN